MPTAAATRSSPASGAGGRRSVRESHQVSIIVRDLNDQELLEVALIENVQRSDLNAIEEATGYNDLTERFGYTQEQLADVIGKSRSHIANTLRLLKLPPAVRSLVATGALTAGHARALVGRDDAEVPRATHRCPGFECARGGGAGSERGQKR